MPTKNKIIAAIVVLLATFAAGRYSVPTKTKIVTQTVEVEKKDVNKKTDDNDHKRIIEVKVTKPGGETIDTTTTTDDNTSKTDTVADTTVDQTTTQTEGSHEGRGTPQSLSLGGVKCFSAKCINALCLRRSRHQEFVGASDTWRFWNDGRCGRIVYRIGVLK